MKLEVQIGGKKRTVEVVREAGARDSKKLLWRLDGKPITVDAVEVATATYSILLEGQSFEVRVQPAESGLRIHTGEEELRAVVTDPRQWRGRRGALAEAEGRQQITAPMPGKVVRVLVAAGAQVTAGQGLVVVEAMKMQNEIKSPKTGTVERLLVGEGQSVNAGDTLAVVS